MQELLKGNDRATQITDLADWLPQRPAPAPRSVWINARVTQLTRIALAGRGIQIQSDPPPPLSPGECSKLVRDALPLSFWRATGSTSG